MAVRSRLVAIALASIAAALLVAPARGQERGIPGWAPHWSLPLRVIGLHIDPTSQRVIAGSDPAFVLDLATGTVASTFELAFGRVLAIAADGTIAATGRDATGGSAVHVRHADGTTRTITIADEDGMLGDLAVDDAGRFLAVEVTRGEGPATRDYDHGVELFDLRGDTPGRLLRRISAGSLINGVAFDPGAKRLACVSQDEVLQIVEIETGNVLHAIAAGVNFSGVTFSPDGERLVTSDFARTIRIWSAETGELLDAIPARQKVQAMSRLAGERGQLLATGHWGGAVRLWNLETSEMVGEIPGEDGVVGAVDLSPDGNWLAFTTGLMANPTVHVWRRGDAPPAPVAAGPWTGILPVGHYGVAFGADDKLYGANRDGLLAWDLSAPLSATPLAEAARMTRLAWVGDSPHGVLFASPAGLELARAEGGDRVVLAKRPAPEGFPLPQKTGAVSPTGKHALLVERGDGGRVVTLVPVPKGKARKLPELDFGMRGPRFAFDAKGKLLAVAGKKTIHVFATKSAKQVGVLPGRADLAVGFGPGGKALIGVHSTYDGVEVRIWKVKSGEVAFEKTFEEAEIGEVHGALIAPDGRRVVMLGGFKATVLDLKTQAVSVVALRVEATFEPVLAISADGERIVVATDDLTEVVKIAD